jgi:predicted negative regulator of RcsB-dependent stress response
MTADQQPPPWANESSRVGNGKRWYDPNRVVLVLFAIVGFLVVGWGGWVFVSARASESKNIEQDQRIQTLERFMDRVDTKLDRLLERQPK